MNIINYITVTLYGIILTALFIKEKKTKLHIIGLSLVYIISGIVNLFLYTYCGKNTVYILYPLTVHIPLLIYCIALIKTPPYEALFALGAAYTLTTPRKWIAEAIMYSTGHKILTEAAVQITVSAILVLLTARFLSPVVNKIFSSNNKEVKYICIPPLVLYVISYATTVYSDLWFKYPNFSIPFLTTVISVLFIIFEVYFFNCITQNINTRHNKEILELQIRFAQRLSQHINNGENYFCRNKTLNAFLSMYKTYSNAKNIYFICDSNLNDELNCFDILAIITSMLDDALANAKTYIKFKALQNGGQICIMSQTDGKAVYDNVMLSALKSAVLKKKGIIECAKDQYKIQMALKI